jgi:hypothetical protein
MRGMVAFFLLIAAQGFVPAPAVAAPNDFRVISGTLLHPGTLGSGMTVMVLKSDEGAVYYADLRAVSGIPALQRGAMVTLVGFEGARPDQLVIQVMYPADVAPVDTPSVRSQRINGRIGSLAGPTVVVRAADGSEATMLLRGISVTILRLLRPGDWVTIFGRPGDTDFVVTGIIHRED